MGRPKLIYSLKDIERKTGISYPTLILYAKEFADQIPTLGSGRTRRYPAEAVAIFQQIFAKRRPGRKPGAAWRGPNASPADGEASPPVPLVQLAEEDRELMEPDGSLAGGCSQAASLHGGGELLLGVGVLSLPASGG